MVNTAVESMINELKDSFSMMNHDVRVEFFTNVISLFGPYLRDNGQFMLDVFKAAEDSGVHLIPINYYSPIPTSDAYPDTKSPALICSEELGVVIPPSTQPAMFAEVCQYTSELQDIPFLSENATEMRWGNTMFGVADSSVYYAMIRKFNSAKVLEIGSGFSTLVAIKAAKENQQTVVECVEPYPTDFFSKHLQFLDEITLTVDFVQNVPLEKFKELEANDILFIDSSHAVKPLSDVEFLIFRVLPTLNKGVVVHFHDIFLPYGYSRTNYEDHRRFWNENYVLGAFLAGNPNWSVLMSNYNLTNSQLQELCEDLSGGDKRKRDQLFGNCSGGSLWIQKQ